MITRTTTARSLLAIALLLCIMAGCKPAAPVNARIPAPATAPIKIRINPKDGAEMVYVPAGQFTMGDNDMNKSLHDCPQHKVYLDAFWIYKNLASVAQYRKFCKATGRKMPDPPDWGWKDDHPIVNVTKDDAKAYCDWAGASLPIEAQWEKAARGTDGRKYPWGNQWDPGKLQCSKKDLGDAGSTAPVGSYPGGASPYGCLDMAGNVWQWCADWYDESYYAKSPARNPTGPATGADRVMRGGSWIIDFVRNFRCADRVRNLPDVRIGLIGFRCVVRAGS